MKNKTHLLTFTITLAFIFSFNLKSQPPKNSIFVYFGTQAKGPGKGFSIATFDTVTGNLSVPQFIQEAASPSFFVIDKQGKYLYSTNAVDSFQNQVSGSISAYRINPLNGNLTLLNQKSSGGQGPCYVSIDGNGKYVLAANYKGGNLSVLSIDNMGQLGKQTAFDQHTGSSVHPVRQTKAYAHCIKADPTNHFVLVTDLGVDKVYVYLFNSSDGSLKPNDPAYASLTAGSGPRHFTFHPNGKWVYVVNELANSVMVFDWDNKKGSLTEIQSISTLPADFQGTNTGAEIAVYPNGKFLYASNRGHNSIALFNINQTNGKLELIERVSSEGNLPRNFIFDPSNKWMIVTNHGTNNAVVFKIDSKTGKLTFTGNQQPVPYPFCIQFLKIK
jgi:6-phosphogluconolactonase